MPTQREAEPDERYICEVYRHVSGYGVRWEFQDSGEDLEALHAVTEWCSRLFDWPRRFFRVHPDGRREVVQ